MWGKAHRGKIVHPDQFAAWEHVDRLARDVGVFDLLSVGVYPCRWGAHYQCGQVFTEHWHVGHRPGSGREGKEKHEDV
jgi:hypothetical protein